MSASSWSWMHIFRILGSSKQVEASSVKNRQKSDVSVKLDVNEFVTYKCRLLYIGTTRLVQAGR